MNVDHMDELEVSSDDTNVPGGENLAAGSVAANETDDDISTGSNNLKPGDAPKHEQSAVDFDRIGKITVSVEAILGGLSMPVSKLIGLKKNEVLTMDNDIGAPVEIRANGNPIARGEIVVVEGDKPKFGVSVTEIIHNN